MKDHSVSKRMSAVDVDQHILDIYEFKRRIGKGAYGIVWKAVERKTKEIVAVKKIFDAFKNKTDAQRTYREITFLQAFSHHPNIIKLKALHKATNNLDIYLVFEYMDTDLHNAISQRTVLEDVHKRFVMYQLLKATKFIHSGNVVHRDQKPSNVLVDRRCRCKVADFGLARSLLRPDDAYDALADNPLTDYVATRWYRPPEVLLSSRRYTQGVDMWSLGCILAEMLLGKALFPGSSSVDQIERILTALPTPSREDVRAVCGGGPGAALLQRSPPPGAPLVTLLRGQPPDAVDLVSRLLVLNPERRLSAAQALTHPYVRRFRDQSLGYTVSRRIIPELSDDHQWSVDEYRTRLYDVLISKHSPPRVEESRRGSNGARTGCGRSRGTAAARAPAPAPAPAATPAPATQGVALPRVDRESAATALASRRRHTLVCSSTLDGKKGESHGERVKPLCVKCSAAVRRHSSAPVPAAAIENCVSVSNVTAPPQMHLQLESKSSQRCQKRQEGFIRVTEWINNKYKFKPQAASTPHSLPFNGPEEDVPRKLDCMEFVMHAPSDYYKARNTPYPPVHSTEEGPFIWTRLTPHFRPP